MKGQMPNLESVIEDSLSDAQLAPEPVEAAEPVEASPTPVETAPETSQDAPEPTLFGGTEEESKSAEVASPAVNQQVQPAKELDEFEKKYGVQKESVPGRENRIPYSRVTKIVGKAVSEAKAEAENKIKTEYEPKLQTLSTENQAYKAQLERVAQFEQVMVNDVPRFIGMLKTLPQYQQFFAQFEQQTPTNQQAQSSQSQVNPEDEMPQPDQLMPDGSYMYSMEGLAKLQAWNRAQARKEVLSEVEKTYGPIHQEWEAHRRLRAVEPKVRDQIARARTWTLFNENEAEIVKVLQQYPDASLEDAYQFVVQPKLQEKLASYQTDEAKLRQQIRNEVLAELKKAPSATSAPTRPSRPQPVTSTGPKRLEDIIAEKVNEIR